MINQNTKSPRIFYGWWIVGAGFLSALIILGLINLGFTAFFEPLAAEFGWSYAQISLAASLQGAGNGFLSPVMGMMVDRWGPRRLMIGGVSLVGASLVFLSYTDSLGWFYAGFILVAAGMSSASPTIMSTTVANWFSRRLGLAMGIMACGFAFGGFLVPLVVTLIDTFGWRMALLVMGLAAWGIGLPLAMVFRQRPEQYGYLPDGEKSVVTDPGQVPVAAEMVIGTKQALKTRTFWHIGLAGLFQSVSIGTALTHVMPFLGTIGIPRSTASLVAMAVPLSSIVGRLSAGWLSDRFVKKKVAAGFFLATVLGLICITLVSTGIKWLVFPYIIFFGIGWATNSTVRVTMLREYFGRSSFGSIFGISMGLSAFGMIIGPIFAGWVYDTQGSYEIAWIALIFLVLAGAVIIAATPPLKIKPKNRTRQAAAG